MPLGIQRLNAKKSQPNDRIVFLKPLKGADEAIARDFLERIAAQCCEFFLSFFILFLVCCFFHFYFHFYFPALPCITP